MSESPRFGLIPGGKVSIDASGFSGNLTPADDTAQKVAAALDALVIGGGGGGGFWDCTVGPVGGQYASVVAAYADGKTRPLVIENVTEAAGVAVPAGGGCVAIVPGKQWSMGDYSISYPSGGRLKVVGLDRKTSVFHYARTGLNVPLISGPGADSYFELCDLKLHNASTNSGNRLFYNARVALEMNNVEWALPAQQNPGVGFDNTSLPAKLRDVELVGGGGSPGVVFESSTSFAGFDCLGLVISGSFAVAPSIFKLGGGSNKIRILDTEIRTTSGLYFTFSNGGDALDPILRGVSAAGAFVLIIGPGSGGVYADVGGAVGSSVYISLGNRTRYENVRGIVSITSGAGAYASMVGCFVEAATVNLTSDYCDYRDNTFTNGVVTMKNGAIKNLLAGNKFPGGSLSIEAGATYTRCIGNATPTGAIANAEPTTEEFGTSVI